MDFCFDRQVLFMATALSIALVGCGDSSDSSQEAANVAPFISSDAVITAIEDIEYSYQVSATDPDNASLDYTLANAPEGMSINDAGLITWTPLESVLTSGSVTVTVSDGMLAVSQEFEVNVTPVNDAPMVSEVIAQTVEAGLNFTYQLVVTDVDDIDIETDISFEVLAGPTALEISTTGLINYQSVVPVTTATDISIKVADGGEDSAEAAIVNFTLDEQFFVTVSGSTHNYFNGEAIVNSQVSISNGTEILQQLISDASGDFSTRIQDIKLAERLTISADARNFSEAALSVSNQELTQSLALQLQPVHASVSFNPTETNELKVEDALLVSLPENSLVDGEGNIVENAVVAELTIINPAIDIELMPGDMLTSDDNGEVVPIESFGAITVSFEDESGNPLQLAEGKTAVIQIPAVGPNKPSVIPLYYFEKISGLWIKEGEASLMSGSNGDEYYSGEVSHFTTWNADRIYETVMLNSCVTDEEGNRLANARVISDGRDYLGRSVTYSNDDGLFSLPVRVNSSVLIGATIGFQSRTVIVNTTAIDKVLDTCLVLSEALTKITLNWGEAPSDLDSHLFITDSEGNQEHVYFGNPEVIVGDSVIYLDVDDVTSYGPEIISIPDFPSVGRYDYYVHNFSVIPDIAPVTTRVEVIFNNQQYLFSPPAEGITDWWHVARIEKTASGQLVFTSFNEWTVSPSDSVFALSVSRGQSILSVLAPHKLESVVKGLIKQKYYKQ